MKLFKSIMSIIINIIIIPLIIILSYGVLFYALPNIQDTQLSLWLLKYLNKESIFWIFIGTAILLIILFVVNIFLRKEMNAKFKNLFIHLDTWVGCLVIIGLVVYTFICVNPLVANEVTISNARKIGMGTIMLCLVLFHLFSSKVSKIVNRRIQAYETAKESNIVGRGSVVFNNILKLAEILFPEISVLVLICLCVSWNVSCYFIYILIATTLPLIGNIRADIITREEIKTTKDKENGQFAQEVAEIIKKENKKGKLKKGR